MYFDKPKRKFQMWAKNPQVVPLPQISNLPDFKHKSFRSYKEFNQWKHERLLELARKGGAEWMS